MIKKHTITTSANLRKMLEDPTRRPELAAYLRIAPFIFEFLARAVLGPMNRQEAQASYRENTWAWLCDTPLRRRLEGALEVACRAATEIYVIPGIPVLYHRTLFYRRGLRHVLYTLEGSCTIRDQIVTIDKSSGY